MIQLFFGFLRGPRLLGLGRTALAGDVANGNNTTKVRLSNSKHWNKFETQTKEGAENA
jgi:hypothetical protein